MAKVSFFSVTMNMFTRLCCKIFFHCIFKSSSVNVILLLISTDNSIKKSLMCHILTFVKWLKKNR